MTLIAAASIGSFGVLSWMYLRGAQISRDDILYAAVLWKLSAVYALFRLSISSTAQAKKFLTVTLFSAVPVALIGLTQAAGVSVVEQLLVNFSSDDDPVAAVSNNRASSTIGAPIPFGDYMLVVGAICWALAAFAPWKRTYILRLLSCLFFISALASGQASAVVGLVIVLITLGAFTRQSGRVVALAALATPFAWLLLQRVLSARASQATGANGLPASWVGPNGRLANLKQYVLPPLSDGLNWLFGVRPSSRIPSVEGWRQWVYIESGYLWILWSGGVLLLVAFIAMMISLWQLSKSLRLCNDGAARAIGTVLASVTLMLIVLMSLDPHLTYRGSSDLIFAVAGACATLHGSGRAHENHASTPKHFLSESAPQAKVVR